METSTLWTSEVRINAPHPACLQALLSRLQINTASEVSTRESQVPVSIV